MIGARSRFANACRAAQPNNLAMIRNLAESYSSIAVELTQIGDWNGTLQYRHQALAKYLALVSGGARSAEDFNGLSLAYMRMGTILTQQKQFEEGVHNLNRSMEVAREGLREFGRNQQLRMTETAALRSLANLELERDRPDQAILHFEQVNLIYQQMVAADPDEFRVSSLLALTHHRLGQAWLKKKNTGAALREFSRGLEIRQRLAQKSPANAGAQGEVAESCAAMGELHAALKNKPRAREWWARARVTLTQLQQSGRANSASRAIMAAVNQKLSEL